MKIQDTNVYVLNINSSNDDIHTDKHWSDKEKKIIPKMVNILNLYLIYRFNIFDEKDIINYYIYNDNSQLSTVGEAVCPHSTNLGTATILKDDGEWYSGCLIPSFKDKERIKQEWFKNQNCLLILRENGFTEFKYLPNYLIPKKYTLIKNIPYFVIYDCSKTKPDGISNDINEFKATKEENEHDSEAIFINLLNYELKKENKFNIKPKMEKAILITERIPCPSCANLIIQFCKKYPNFELILGYMYKQGNNRGFMDFYKEIIAEGIKNISVYNIIEYGNERHFIALFNEEIINDSNGDNIILSQNIERLMRKGEEIRGLLYHDKINSLFVLDSVDLLNASNLFRCLPLDEDKKIEMHYSYNEEKPCETNYVICKKISNKKELVFLLFNKEYINNMVIDIDKYEGLQSLKNIRIEYKLLSGNVGSIDKLWEKIKQMEKKVEDEYLEKFNKSLKINLDLVLNKKDIKYFSDKKEVEILLNGNFTVTFFWK